MGSLEEDTQDPEVGTGCLEMGLERALGSGLEGLVGL